VHHLPYCWLTSTSNLTSSNAPSGATNQPYPTKISNDIQLCVSFQCSSAHSSTPHSCSDPCRSVLFASPLHPTHRSVTLKHVTTSHYYHANNFALHANCSLLSIFVPQSKTTHEVERHHTKDQSLNSPLIFGLPSDNDPSQKPTEIVQASKTQTRTEHNQAHPTQQS